MPGYAVPPLRRRRPVLNMLPLPVKRHRRNAQLRRAVVLKCVVQLVQQPLPHPLVPKRPFQKADGLKKPTLAHKPPRLRLVRHPFVPRHPLRTDAMPKPVLAV